MFAKKIVTYSYYYSCNSVISCTNQTHKFHNNFTANVLWETNNGHLNGFRAFRISNVHTRRFMITAAWRKWNLASFGWSYKSVFIAKLSGNPEKPRIRSCAIDTVAIISRLASRYRIFWEATALFGYRRYTMDLCNFVITSRSRFWDAAA